MFKLVGAGLIPAQGPFIRSSGVARFFLEKTDQDQRAIQQHETLVVPDRSFYGLHHKRNLSDAMNQGQPKSR
jgi:hypothetical protein